MNTQYNQDSPLRLVAFGLSALLRTSALFLIFYIIYNHQLITIFTKIPVESSFQAPFVRHVSNYFLSSIHTVVNTFNRIPTFPFYILLVIIGTTLIVSFIHFSNPYLKRGITTKFFSVVANIASTSVLWYQFGPHTSEVIVDMRGLFTVVRQSDLPLKREAFVEAYSSTFKDLLNQKMPLLAQTEVDRLLKEKLEVILSLQNDHYYLVKTLSDVKHSAGSLANFDAVSCSLLLVEEQLLTTHTLLLAKINEYQQLTSNMIPWGTLLKVVVVLAGITAAGVLLYQFFGNPVADAALGLAKSNAAAISKVNLALVDLNKLHNNSIDSLREQAKHNLANYGNEAQKVFSFKFDYLFEKVGILTKQSKENYEVSKVLINSVAELKKTHANSLAIHGENIAGVLMKHSKDIALSTSHNNDAILKLTEDLSALRAQHSLLSASHSELAITVRDRLGEAAILVAESL